MKKLLLAAAISLAVISAGTTSLAAERAKEIKTEQGPGHREIFEIPLLVDLPQRASLLKTPTGAEDRQAKITLDASVLYVPIDVLMKECSAEKLKERGLDLKSEAEMMWNGSRAILLKVFQPLEGGKVKGQWILMIDRADHTWMVNGAYDAQSQKSSAEVLSILRSAWWDGDDLPPEMAAERLLNAHTLGTPFKLAKSSSGALIYTKDGKLPTEVPDRAVFVVSKISNLHVPADRRASFAREKCEGVALGAELVVISENSWQVDGRQVCEIIATADSEEEETLISQTMLFDTRSGYNVMVGVAHADGEANVGHFKRLAENFLAASERCVGLSNILEPEFIKLGGLKNQLHPF